MNGSPDPIVGNWYQRSDKGQAFLVVDVDETAGLVECQHFDGDLEELDLDLWYRLAVIPIEPPEDWSGPLDVEVLDDLSEDTGTETAPTDWGEPLDELRVAADLPPGDESPVEPADVADALAEEQPLDFEPAVPATQEQAAESVPPPRLNAWSEN